ncbi:hypothetical protein GW17_00061021, partial [Ensete ventricosum]
ANESDGSSRMQRSDPEMKSSHRAGIEVVIYYKWGCLGRGVRKPTTMGLAREEEADGEEGPSRTSDDREEDAHPGHWTSEDYH